MNSVLPVSSTFDSRVESVDVAEELTRRFAQAVGFEEPDQYFIGLAFREIFINAIKHGNHFDRNKRVTVGLSNSGNCLVIEVIDDGDGFQLTDVPNARATENLESRSGRGLMIALGVMDEFNVEKKPLKGMLVRMAKHLDKL